MRAPPCGPWPADSYHSPAHRGNEEAAHRPPTAGPLRCEAGPDKPGVSRAL